MSLSAKVGKTFMFKSRLSNGILWISGIGCGSKWYLNLWLVNKWMQTPDITRPALPLRWKALALDTQTVSKLSIFLFGSKRFSFIFPESITNTQSSIVTEVSAMFVESIIFLTPSLGFLLDKILEKNCKGYLMSN